MDRVCLVTGAAGGIGRAVVSAFAAEGARLVLVGRTGAKVEALAAELRQGGVAAVALGADVAEPAGARGAVALALDRFGRLDVLINNAGKVPSRTPIAETDVALFDEAYRANLRSVYLCTQAAIPALRAAKGAIVNVASTAAKTGALTVGPGYAAAKAGVIALTKSTARELAPDARANVVAPGPVDTPMLDDVRGPKFDAYLSTIPLGRMATADDVAFAVLYLASERSAYLTGAVIDVNGGMLMD
ncbi:MAG: SDR family oxidoreductase [Chloroflexi bacterium]|nr:SDR family oxidoreductase [Chloroflexota bacterium]